MLQASEKCVIGTNGTGVGFNTYLTKTFWNWLRLVLKCNTQKKCMWIAYFSVFYQTMANHRYITFYQISNEQVEYFHKRKYKENVGSETVWKETKRKRKNSSSSKFYAVVKEALDRNPWRQIIRTRSHQEADYDPQT